MSEYLITNSRGFNTGYQAITTIGEAINDTGMNFGILKLTAGEERDISSDLESAYLLVDGSVSFFYDGNSYHGQRSSLFDQAPIAIHYAADAKVQIKAETDCELAVVQTKNRTSFSTMVFDKRNMLENEKRGKGILNDTAFRYVRTIFDDRNRPEANLVLGEVINFPGCWSSYPPHHHSQPEIYHYRFTEPQGYGHAELGDSVHKVQQYDTIKILNENDHAQVAAPGYGMYYIWMIRHLDNNRYNVPEFTQAHDWTRDKNANEKVWQEK